MYFSKGLKAQQAVVRRRGVLRLPVRAPSRLLCTYSRMKFLPTTMLVQKASSIASIQHESHCDNRVRYLSMSSSSTTTHCTWKYSKYISIPFVPGLLLGILEYWAQPQLSTRLYKHIYQFPHCAPMHYVTIVAHYTVRFSGGCLTGCSPQSLGSPPPPLRAAVYTMQSRYASRTTHHAHKRTLPKKSARSNIFLYFLSDLKSLAKVYGRSCQAPSHRYHCFVSHPPDNSKLSLPNTMHAYVHHTKRQHDINSKTNLVDTT